MYVLAHRGATTVRPSLMILAQPDAIARGEETSTPMDSTNNRFKHVEPDPAEPSEKTHPIDVSRRTTDSPSRSTLETPSRSSASGAVLKAVIAFVVFSLTFFAFAGGMLFQRFVVAEEPGASQAGQAATADSGDGEVDGPAAFEEAWNLVQEQYVQPEIINEEAMLEAAIDGMLDTLQDEGHTRYLTEEENQASDEQLSGEYVGVGIHVQETEEGITVVAPIDNSPAMDAGIRPGDVLIRVDGQDVSGQAVGDVVERVRGEEGTQVTLTFRREGEPDPLTFTLTRSAIETSSVSWTMLDGNIAFIRLSQFTATSGDDMVAALQEAIDAGAEGVIFDLRNNPGGYISQAVQIGSLFVPEGSTIFISQVRDGSQQPYEATEQPVNIGDLPLVVLINEGSASSSEIVSGAIKANNPNATVIGEQTFGTGTVLSSFDLGEDGGTILLGTELWLTPDGKLIKNFGIAPDVVVPLQEGQFPFISVDNAGPPPDDLNDFQLEWALDTLQSVTTP